VEKEMSESLLGMLGELKRKPEELSPLTLAYIGDAVQEIFVRHHLIVSGLSKPNQLQRAAAQYVSATGQARAIHAIYDHLTEEEIAVYKRGRNAKSANITRRNNVQQYRQGTGLEALLGYLYLSGQEKRLETVMRMIMDVEPLSERGK
jgi:ribonuclease-3 family protein